MGVTIAHRPHAHIRLQWRTIAVVLVAAAVAMVVLVLVNQPWETTSQATSVSAVSTAAGTSAATVDLPRELSHVIRGATINRTPPAASPQAPTATRTTPHWPRRTEP